MRKDFLYKVSKAQIIRKRKNLNDYIRFEGFYSMHNTMGKALKQMTSREK